ncbi:exodeoxyribonuclease V subunit gamma [Williamsia serinedens]|uniref:RecBCD enzyme subunit RecC n=1 Tax=Williamsia serinedens TaxID=391736 RepID=A0ABT1GWW4_9NOCA|nr:exodeoxyribonuclease V subunit gamma [Williamsia serinedens]MCP2159464.1 DNA helicase/exodeoxyribonuclease V, gamma subunit [Williamsia serinedens]
MFTLHRSPRTDVLADALAGILVQPLIDPFAAEVVAVPAKGVERWLAQRLALTLGATPGADDGVAANIDFRSASDLVDGVLSGVRGHRMVEDPWATARVRWHLLDVVDECAGLPGCAVLARHLGVDGPTVDAHRAGRRWATAGHLTRLFRAYAASRPAMLSAWTRGDDIDGVTDDDGSPRPVDDDLLWQPVVWRALRDRIGTPSPAEMLDDLCARIRQDPTSVDLPARVALFGPTRLTTQQLAVLSAVAAHRDVHVFLPHPSDALWRSEVAGGAVRRRDLRRALSPHPLVASLSREVRETRHRLGAVVDDDLHHPLPSERPATLLGRLQSGIEADEPPSSGSAVADGTVTVHACHGPARQVEVARDVIVRMFADDPTLTPRDVVVMCPDIELFAPLVAASFGQDATTHPAHRLRVRLADRGLTATNAVLDTVVAVHALAGSRITAGDVADLAAREPVARRFGLDDDALERIDDWLVRAGVRWGLGEPQRRAFGLGGFPQNTMETGIDRLALGVVADELDGWIDRALPLADIESADVDLVGRFVDLVDRLERCVGDLSGVHTNDEWRDALIRVVTDLTESDRTEAWQTARAIAEIDAAFDHGGTLTLRRADVTSLLDEMVAARPTRANFRTGELTVCSMVPMRSVPHRAVVLLGLDDDTYPRATRADGDDVLGRDPVVGERDPRAEDRQLLMDTIMSATDRLAVCFTGTDPVSGLRRPPSVPVSELLDTLVTLTGADGPDAIVTRHPLHAFDPASFTTEPVAGATDPTPHPFSYDTVALAGARALLGPSSGTLAFDRTPIPLTDEMAHADVDLGDLVAFLEHPTRGFLRQRLHTGVPEAEDVLPDAMSADLDSLERWGIGDRILSRRLDGIDLTTLRAVELRRGVLPPFDFGLRALDDIVDVVDRIVGAAGPEALTPRVTVDVDVTLPDGRRVTGTVDSLRHTDTGLRTVTASFSRLSAKRRVAAWATLLATAASVPGIVGARTVGRGRGTAIAVADLTVPDDPIALLAGLVALRDRGLQAPLPAPVSATAAYAERRGRGVDHEPALDAARADYESRFGEHTDRFEQFVFPGGFDEIAASDTDLRDIAARIWQPLTAHETTTTR